MKLAPHWAAFKRAARQEDLFVFLSRGLVYAGMFFLTMLHFKVTQGLNLSDGIFLIAAILLFLSRRPPPRAPATPAWYVGAFIFLLAGVIASTQADSKAGSLLVVINAIYLFFVLQYLLRQQLNNKIRMQRALGAFILGTTVSAFVAVLQIEFGILLPSVASTAGSIGGNDRAVGFSQQPNLLGVALALGIIFAIGLFLELNKRKHWYLMACVIVMATALLLSASVSGMGTTLVGLLVLFIARGTPFRTVAMILLSFLAAYVLVFGVIDRGSHLDPITRIERTFSSSGGTNSGTVQLRIDTWKAAWSGIVEKPVVGHGLDQTTLALYFDKSIYVYYPAHNLILLYWYGGGIFLLVALALMTGSAFNRLLSGRRLMGKNRDPLRAIVLAACVGDLAFAMQSPELVDRWFWIPFLLALCFRDPAVPPAPAVDAIELPLSATGGTRAPATTPPAANGGPRRVRGKVGKHAAPSSGSR